MIKGVAESFMRDVYSDSLKSIIIIGEKDDGISYGVVASKDQAVKLIKEFLKDQRISLSELV